jgi:hypothetical protein
MVEEDEWRYIWPLKTPNKNTRRINTSLRRLVGCREERPSREQRKFLFQRFLGERREERESTI